MPTTKVALKIAYRDHGITYTSPQEIDPKNWVWDPDIDPANDRNPYYQYDKYPLSQRLNDYRTLVCGRYADRIAKAIFNREKRLYPVTTTPEQSQTP